MELIDSPTRAGPYGYPYPACMLAFWVLPVVTNSYYQASAVRICKDGDFFAGFLESNNATIDERAGFSGRHHETN
jgi:hypothetical protein